MGLVPREQLIHSVAPFSDAARVMWGFSEISMTS
jgi:arginine:agmatine antiporter